MNRVLKRSIFPGTLEGMRIYKCIMCLSVRHQRTARASYWILSLNFTKTINKYIEYKIYLFLSKSIFGFDKGIILKKSEYWRCLQFGRLPARSDISLNIFYFMNMTMYGILSIQI